MGDETISTIGTLLESLLQDADDPEMRYKLRTALQLLEVPRTDRSRLETAAEVDDDLGRRLRDLGYLD